MNITELVRKNRSYRRYDESISISYDELKSFINLARLSPFGANLQSLKYLIINDDRKETVFSQLKWAAYIKDKKGYPVKGERPSAYIIVLNDTDIAKEKGINTGIAIQSILLGAVDKGYGGCILQSFNKELKDELHIDDRYNIMAVLAIGKPIETVVIEDVKNNGDVKYWRDENKVHHVPKRKLDDLIIN